MKVLVDTSVWIEFFSRRSIVDVTALTVLIESRQILTCFPIMAECLSGRTVAAERATIQRAFFSMDRIDVDWNREENWLQIADLSSALRERRVKSPGLVDRMILLCTKTADAAIWTLDKTLKKAAEAIRLGIYT